MFGIIRFRGQFQVVLGLSLESLSWSIEKIHSSVHFFSPGRRTVLRIGGHSRLTGFRRLSGFGHHDQNWPPRAPAICRPDGAALLEPCRGASASLPCSDGVPVSNCTVKWYRLPLSVGTEVRFFSSGRLNGYGGRWSR
jgi:hypothetical protein